MMSREDISPHIRNALDALRGQNLRNRRTVIDSLSRMINLDSKYEVATGFEWSKVLHEVLMVETKYIEYPKNRGKKKTSSSASHKFDESFDVSNARYFKNIMIHGLNIVDLPRRSSITFSFNALIEHLIFVLNLRDCPDTYKYEYIEILCKVLEPRTCQYLSIDIIEKLIIFLQTSITFPMKLSEMKLKKYLKVLRSTMNIFLIDNSAIEALHNMIEWLLNSLENEFQASDDVDRSLILPAIVESYTALLQYHKDKCLWKFSQPTKVVMFPLDLLVHLLSAVSLTNRDPYLQLFNEIIDMSSSLYLGNVLNKCSRKYMYSLYQYLGSDKELTSIVLSSRALVTNRSQKEVSCFSSSLSNSRVYLNLEMVAKLFVFLLHSSIGDSTNISNKESLSSQTNGTTSNKRQKHAHSFAKVEFRLPDLSPSQDEREKDRHGNNCSPLTTTTQTHDLVGRVNSSKLVDISLVESKIILLIVLARLYPNGEFLVHPSSTSYERSLRLLEHLRNVRYILVHALSTNIENRIVGEIMICMRYLTIVSRNVMSDDSTTKSMFLSTWGNLVSNLIEHESFPKFCKTCKVGSIGELALDVLLKVTNHDLIENALKLQINNKIYQLGLLADPRNRDSHIMLHLIANYCRHQLGDVAPFCLSFVTSFLSTDALSTRLLNLSTQAGSLQACVYLAVWIGEHSCTKLTHRFVGDSIQPYLTAVEDIFGAVLGVPMIDSLSSICDDPGVNECFTMKLDSFDISRVEMNTRTVTLMQVHTIDAPDNCLELMDNCISLLEELMQTIFGHDPSNTRIESKHKYLTQKEFAAILICHAYSVIIWYVSSFILPQVEKTKAVEKLISCFHKSMIQLLDVMLKRIYDLEDSYVRTMLSALCQCTVIISSACSSASIENSFDTQSGQQILRKWENVATALCAKASDYNQPESMGGIYSNDDIEMDTMMDDSDDDITSTKISSLNIDPKVCKLRLDFNDDLRKAFCDTLITVNILTNLICHKSVSNRKYVDKQDPHVTTCLKNLQQLSDIPQNENLKAKDVCVPSRTLMLILLQLSRDISGTQVYNMLSGSGWERTIGALGFILYSHICNNIIQYQLHSLKPILFEHMASVVFGSDFPGLNQRGRNTELFGSEIWKLREMHIRTAALIAQNMNHLGLADSEESGVEEMKKFIRITFGDMIYLDGLVDMDIRVRDEAVRNLHIILEICREHGSIYHDLFHTVYCNVLDSEALEYDSAAVTIAKACCQIAIVDNDYVQNAIVDIMRICTTRNKLMMSYIQNDDKYTNLVSWVHSIVDYDVVMERMLQNLAEKLEYKSTSELMAEYCRQTIREWLQFTGDEIDTNNFSRASQLQISDFPFQVLNMQNVKELLTQYSLQFLREIIALAAKDDIGWRWRWYQLENYSRSRCGETSDRAIRSVVTENIIGIVTEEIRVSSDIFDDSLVRIRRGIKSNEDLKSDISIYCTDYLLHLLKNLTELHQVNIANEEGEVLVNLIVKMVDYPDNQKSRLDAKTEADRSRTVIDFLTKCNIPLIMSYLCSQLQRLRSGKCRLNLLQTTEVIMNHLPSIDDVLVIKGVFNILLQSLTLACSSTIPVICALMELIQDILKRMDKNACNEQFLAYEVTSIFVAIKYSIYAKYYEVQSIIDINFYGLDMDPVSQACDQCLQVLFERAEDFDWSWYIPKIRVGDEDLIAVVSDRVPLLKSTMSMFVDISDQFLKTGGIHYVCMWLQIVTLREMLDIHLKKELGTNVWSLHPIFTSQCISALTGFCCVNIKLQRAVLNDITHILGLLSAPDPHSIGHEILPLNKFESSRNELLCQQMIRQRMLSISVSLLFGIPDEAVAAAISLRRLRCILTSTRRPPYILAEILQSGGSFNKSIQRSFEPELEDATIVPPILDRNWECWGVSLWSIHSVTYETWICRLVSTLLNNLISQKRQQESGVVNTIDTLEESMNFAEGYYQLSTLNFEISELLFPMVIETLIGIGKDDELAQALNNFILTIENPNHHEKRAIRIVLYSLSYLLRDKHTKFTQIFKKHRDRVVSRDESESEWKTTYETANPFILPLNVNYITICKCAIKCGYTCTAWRFFELHLECQGIPPEDRMEYILNQKYDWLVFNIFSTFHDRDALLSLDSSRSLELQAQLYTEVGKWPEAMSTYESMLQTLTEPKHSPVIGIARGLKEQGFHTTLQQFSRNLGDRDADVVRGIASEGAWRFLTLGNFVNHMTVDRSLTQWQLPNNTRGEELVDLPTTSSESIDAGPNMNPLYLFNTDIAAALNNICYCRYNAAQQRIETSLDQLIENIGENSAEQSAHSLTNSIVKIQKLVDILEISEECKVARNYDRGGENPPNFKCILSSWSERLSESVTLRESVVSLRLTILRLLLDTKNAEVQDALHLLKDIIIIASDNERAAHLVSPTVYRIGSIVSSAEDVSDIELAEWFLNEAKLQWFKGLRESAMLLIESKVINGLRNCDDKGTSYCSDVLSDALITAGEWCHAIRSRGSLEIVSKYFEPATELKKASNHLRVRTFTTLGKFHAQVYETLRDRISSAEWTKRKEVTELEKKALSQVPKHVNVRKILQANNMDMQERNEVESSVDTHLTSSLRYYKKVLELSTEPDLECIFMVINLWLSNTENGKVNKIMKHISDVTMTYKFVPLCYQIVSRIGHGTSSGDFYDTLQQLIIRIANDHPHHCLHQLIAIFADKTDINSSRSIAVREILDEITQKKDLKALVINMKTLSHAYRLLANQAPPQNFSSGSFRSFYQNNAGRNFLTDVTGILRSRVIPAIPAVYTMRHKLRPDGDYKYSITQIAQIDDKVTVSSSGISRPKIISIIGSDGICYKELVKGQDECRADAIMEQVFEHVNVMLLNNNATSQRCLRIRTYKIVPLGAKAGVLEFVQNTTSFNDYLAGDNGAHNRYRPTDYSSDHCFKLMREADKEAKKRRKTKPLDEVHAYLGGIYRDICKNFKPVFRHFFLEKYSDPSVWQGRRIAYTRSVAANSMLGYILGIGDRHASNILIDVSTAESVHIDFGIAFESGRLLAIPEIVPFRLTRDIVDGMGITGLEGTFRQSSEEVLNLLRDNTQQLLTILEVIMHDPLNEWIILSNKSGTTSDQDNSEGPSAAAHRTLGRVKQRLQGYDERSGDCLNTQGTVRSLILQASDELNLSKMFCGWQAWL